MIKWKTMKTRKNTWGKLDLQSAGGAGLEPERWITNEGFKSLASFQITHLHPPSLSSLLFPLFSCLSHRALYQKK